MNRKLEDEFFQDYLEFFHLAERKRRWNVLDDFPWDQVNPDSDPLLADICETFSAVELFLPDYTAHILQTVRRSRGRAWFTANWGYEESKHSLVLAEWLLRSGHRDEQGLRDFENNLFENTWQFPYDHPRQMMIYTMIQELATFVNYRRLRDLALKEGDHCLARVLQVVGADEKVHYEFYRKGTKRFLHYEPRETLEDLVVVLNTFEMPAKYEIKDYDERARRIAAAGVYGPREYIQFVRDPVLKDLGLTKADLRSIGSQLGDNLENLPPDRRPRFDAARAALDNSRSYTAKHYGGNGQDATPSDRIEVVRFGIIRPDVD